MDSWINYISEIGFPIAITLYTLVSLNKSLRELRDEIRNMSKDSRQ